MTTPDAGATSVAGWSGAAIRSEAEIRAEFPALGRTIGGRPVAYFDGPGGTQVPARVARAVSDYLLHHNANTHWAFPTSIETDALLAGARSALADFLGADPGEIAFGNNMTTLTFHLGRALGRGWKPGDEIVVTELDHHANVDPWRAVAVERGLTVRVARMRPEDGRVDMDDLGRQLNERTRLLAIGGASNAFGTINDVAAAGEMARRAGAMTFVDAVHYAPHRLVDVRALGCDFLACSAYKFYGPHVGILWGRADRLRALDVPKLVPAPDAAPERLETGTQDHEGIVGAAEAVEFLASIGRGDARRARLISAFEGLHERATRLVSRLWDGLGAIGGVTRFGPPADAERTPTVSFSIRGIDPADACERLARAAIFASHGDFYATTAVARMGHAADGLVRVGCACYTTADEVDRLLDEVRSIAGR